MGPMQTRRHYNGLKTILLFVGIIAVLAGVGWILSQSTGDLTWIVVFSLIGLVTTAISYWNSDKVAIRAMKAQPVSPNQAPELHRMVSELAAAYRMPTPRLFVANTEAPNAFATGRNPKNSAVCVTTGRYRRPDRDPGARFATRVVSVVGWSADTSVQASDTEGNHP